MRHVLLHKVKGHLNRGGVECQSEGFIWCLGVKLKYLRCSCLLATGLGRQPHLSPDSALKLQSRRYLRVTEGSISETQFENRQNTHHCMFSQFNKQSIRSAPTTITTVRGQGSRQGEQDYVKLTPSPSTRLPRAQKRFILGKVT